MISLNRQVEGVAIAVADFFLRRYFIRIDRSDRSRGNKPDNCSPSPSPC
jgi:hypothetical protein